MACYSLLEAAVFLTGAIYVFADSLDIATAPLAKQLYCKAKTILVEGPVNAKKSRLSFSKSSK